MTWTDTVTGEARKCTDCGLCLAACPTFTASHAEGDSPRGRIHLLTTLLAGGPADATTSAHLAGCIECSACHTPCPTGVRFAVARRAHRIATDSLDRPAFEHRVAELADVIARDPGASLTVRSVQALLTDTGQEPTRSGPLSDGVLALTGTMLNLAAPRVVDRLEASLETRIPRLVRDAQLTSALHRASGLLLDVGLATEHQRALAQAGALIAARRYERLTVAVFDLLDLRLAAEALSPQLSVVAAPTLLPSASPIPTAPASSVCLGFGGDVADATPADYQSSDLPPDVHAASAPVVLTAHSLNAVRDLVQAKGVWLHGRPLVTADSRDLVRFPGSRHMAQLIALGG
jgi:ferredoxin